MKKDKRKEKRYRDFTKWGKKGFKPTNNKEAKRHPCLPKRRENETTEDFNQRILKYHKDKLKVKLKVRKKRSKDRNFNLGRTVKNQESRRKKQTKVHSF